MENNDIEFEKLLDDFINTQLKDIDIGTEIGNSEKKDDAAEAPKEKAVVSSPQKEQKTEPAAEEDGEDEDLAILQPNEKALVKAYRNFKSAIELLAEDFNVKAPKFRLEPNMLYPRYKPSSAAIIAEDTLKGWDVMMDAHPEIKELINPQASDEELLNTAEKSDDDALQFALISYVEILIEMEGCEIAYKERKLKREKKKLERQIYEEHQKRIARANRYINAIKEKKFPIDAERLVKNYFKTAAKDADGAYKVLTQNPAVFAPIDFSKIKPRLFGLLKVKPQDGIRMNRLIGEFLKKLKA